MKKIVCILLCAVVMTCCFTFFSACVDTNALRVINFRPEDEEYYTWVIDEFKKANPGVNIIYESFSTDAYPNVLTSRLQADSVDVFGTEAANVRSIELRKSMLNLDDLKLEDGTSLWDGMKASDLMQSVYSESKYVAPLGSVNLVVYYNKGIMTEVMKTLSFANGQYPTTWVEFQSLLIKLASMQNTNAIDEVIAFGGQEGWTVSMIASAAEIPLIRAEDDDFYLKMVKSQEGYDFNNGWWTTYFERVNEVASYINRKNMQTGQTYALTPSKFATKKCALMIDGTWSYAQMIGTNPDIDVGFFPLPLNDSAEKNVYVSTKSGSAWAINKDSEKTELAKKFVEFQFKSEVYQKYIDFARVNPSLNGYELEDKKAAQMYAFPTKLVMENLWPDGIGGVDYFRSNLLGFILGTRTPKQAQTEFQTMLTSTAYNWQRESVIKPWFDRFYPGEGRDTYAPEA